MTILLSLALLAVLPATAIGHGGKANSFSGSCEFSGTVRFQPPLTNTERPTTGSARAKGPCNGVFTDRRGREHQLDGDLVTYVARNHGSMSCGGGVAEGRGYLRYRGHELRFRLREERAGAVAALQLEGKRGGVAVGQAHVSPDEDPAEILAKCAGEGLGEVRIEGRLESPGISG